MVVPVVPTEGITGIYFFKHGSSGRNGEQNCYTTLRKGRTEMHQVDALFIPVQHRNLFIVFPCFFKVFQFVSTQLPLIF